MVLFWTAWLQQCTPISHPSQPRPPGGAAAGPSAQLPTRLTWLDLSRNVLKALPAALLRCTALAHLAVGGNDLGGMPAGLSCLTGMEKLDLRKNRLSRVSKAASVQGRAFWSFFLQFPAFLGFFCQAVQ